MTSLSGTAALTRFLLRRDRVRIAVWVVAITLLVLSTAASVKGFYPTQADLDTAAAAARDNVAAIVFNGPDQGLDNLGGQIVFQVGAFGLIVVGLMSVFMLGRATRGEEEAGRLDLVRAMPVGEHAPTAAVLLVVVAMNLAVGVAVALSMLAEGLAVAGSVLFGVSVAALGLVFMGVALVAAQVTENTRVVYGVSGTVLGVSFVLRAIGDVGDGTLSWLSPIGWVQKTRPFAGERWWPLVIPAVALAGLVVVAARLAAHRDVGGGLVAPRAGRPVAAPSLGRPVGLAMRLQRGTLIAWSAGLLLIGVAYGSIANNVEEFVADSDAMRDVIAQTGGASLTDSYLATSMLTLALIAAGYAISSALRLRSEETALHAESVLTTGVSRVRWAGSHLALALGGSVAMLAAGGLGTGIAFAVSIGDAGQVPRVLGAALIYAPALWLLVGLALALFGLVPRAVMATWGVLAACWVIGLFGELLQLPGWLRDTSPFAHVPQAPAAGVTVAPLAITVAVAAALLAAGLAGFRHRDVG